MANRKNYQYTCEQPAIWSPMNANLQMQGIKVRHLLESLMMNDDDHVCAGAYQRPSPRRHGDQACWRGRGYFAAAQYIQGDEERGNEEGKGE